MTDDLGVNICIVVMLMWIIASWGSFAWLFCKAGK